MTAHTDLESSLPERKGFGLNLWVKQTLFPFSSGGKFAGIFNPLSGTVHLLLLIDTQVIMTSAQGSTFDLHSE